MRPAKALQGLAKTELRGVLDKLLLQAAKNYWEWALSYQRQELLRQNAELAAVRLRAIRERVRQDDLAAINSIETLTELQNRRAQLAGTGPDAVAKPHLAAQQLPLRRAAAAP